MERQCRINFKRSNDHNFYILVKIDHLESARSSNNYENVHCFTILSSSRNLYVLHKQLEHFEASY